MPNRPGRPQSYETAETQLISRAGLRKLRIPYQSGAVMIAPENRVAFIADVQAHAPQLAKRGQDWFSRSRNLQTPEN